MNLFAHPLLASPKPNTRSVFWAFVSLFALGLALRAVVCAETCSFVHPDEHQQFLEQAHRLVHGYGKKFWEQERGIRHPLYQSVLAVMLGGLELVGVRDPFVQAGALRFIVAGMALGAWALFAWQFQRRGDTAVALLMMFVVSLSPDLIYVHTHPLSELAATIPFLLAVCCLDRRPVVAGMLLGVCFALRFQMGFLIGGMVLLAAAGVRFRPRGDFLRFVLAALGSLLALGVGDWLIFGRPFHTPIEYFRANIVQGISRIYGEHPWYQYFAWIHEHGGLIVLGLAPLLIVGVMREWKFGILLAVFTAAHIAVEHKEARFLLPIVPFALAFVVTGIAGITQYVRSRFRPVVWTIITSAFVTLFALRIPEVQWEPRDAYRSTSKLLHIAGRQPDITGIGVLGIHVTECGNYFFLKRNVPLLGTEDDRTPYFQIDPSLNDIRVNFLIAPSHLMEPYVRWNPVPIAHQSVWTLYRLDRGTPDLK